MSSNSFIDIESADGHQQILHPQGSEPQLLSELLRNGNLPLNTRCGQRGLCNGCTVELIRGKLTNVAGGDSVQASSEPLSLKACQYRVPRQEADVNLSIRVPARSLLAYEPQVVTSFRINVPRAQDPLWQNLRIQRAGAPDLAALCDLVAHRLDAHVPVKPAPALQEASYSLPSGETLFASVEYQGDHWLLSHLSNSPSTSRLGVAIDIGTTTVAAMLVGLDSGHVLSQSGDFNRQMQMGDDVLTRINLCFTEPSFIARMQDAVVKGTIMPLLTEIIEDAGARADQVVSLSIAGNSTMLHLFAGIDPSTMGMAPFTPVFLEHRVMRSSELGLQLDGIDPPVHLLPGAAAYVGADLCAGILSSGLVYDDGPSLLVDVGTNGEIILKVGDRLYGCATAAGPAFEGAGLTCGMRAGDGAISRIKLQSGSDTLDIEIETIGQNGRSTAPAGICGSAYVDFLAQGRATGLLTPSGRFDRSVSGVTQRLIEHEDFGVGFCVARGQGRRDIVISEQDIARLLQAKAAIAAGILILLERENVLPSQVTTLYLAGGFGMHLDLDNAFGSGLLPEFVPSQVQVVGNTSLAGAYLALLDSSSIEEMERIRRQMEIVELNLDPEFESCYIDQLSLP